MGGEKNFRCMNFFFFFLETHLSAGIFFSPLCDFCFSVPPLAEFFFTQVSLTGIFFGGNCHPLSGLSHGPFLIFKYLHPLLVLAIANEFWRQRMKFSDSE